MLPLCRHYGSKQWWWNCGGERHAAALLKENPIPVGMSRGDTSVWLSTTGLRSTGKGAIWPSTYAYCCLTIMIFGRVYNFRSVSANRHSWQVVEVRIACWQMTLKDYALFSPGYLPPLVCYLVSVICVLRSGSNGIGRRAARSVVAQLEHWLCTHGKYNWWLVVRWRRSVLSTPIFESWSSMPQLAYVVVCFLWVQMVPKLISPVK